MTIQMPRPTHCYIGRKKCGCVVAVVTDVPGWEKETGKSVAEFIADGLIIERTTIHDYNAGLPIGCKHSEPDPIQEALL